MDGAAFCIVLYMFDVLGANRQSSVLVSSVRHKTLPTRKEFLRKLPHAFDSH